MRIIERDIRMAGFEYRDTDAKVTYGTISSPLTIKDSGNKCCDEVTVIYDYFDEEAKKAERIRIRYWAEPYTSNKGSRHRLYKQKDILGKNKKILATPVLGNKEVMADYIEDLQISNTSGNSYLYVTSPDQQIDVYDLSERKFVKKIGDGYRGHSLTFGPDGLLYEGVWINYKRVISITNPKTGRTLGTMGKQPLFGGLAFGSDGLLYAASEQSGIHIYDPKTKKLVRTIPISGTSGSALTFGPDGLLYIVHHGGGKYIRKINPNSGKIVGGFNTNRGGSYITGLAFNSSGFIFDSRYSADRIGSYDPSTGNLGVGIGSQRAYCGFTFGPGNLLYAVGKYGGVEIFDVVTNKKVADLKKNHGSRNIYCGVTTESNIKTSALVNITLILRTKNQYGKDRQFKKKDYHAGNYKLDKTDKYKRDTFSSTVLVRNLAL
jgi:WD40 repeat protein